MKKTTRRKYTDEFKDEAVKLVTEQGYKITETARNLGIHDSLLRRWIKDRSPDSKGNSTDSGKVQAELKKGVEKYAPKSVFSNFGLKNQLFFV